MAIIVQDTFDRADDPASLGTSTTGQAWTTILGTFGIESNQGVRFGAGGSGRAVLETGFVDAITKVTLVNPESISTAAGQMGIVFRWVDENYFWSLTYERFFGGLNRLRMKRTYAGSTVTLVDVNVTITNGQTISVAYCGPLFVVYVNDVEQATYDDSSEPQNYGTMCGLRGSGGTLGPGGNQYFEDFLVTTNGTCTPTYNCTGGACVDPGDGSGEFATLDACLTACSTPISYNCVDGVCVDPGDGTGAFATLEECQASGCGGTNPPEIETCSTSIAPQNIAQRVQRVLNFTQEIHRNIQYQISTTAPFTLYGYSLEWVPVSVSQLTEQRNAYGASWQFTELGHAFYCYIAHVSTADLTLTVTTDAGTPATTTDTYPITSSSGSFRKDWVILRARKGKLFDFKITSAEEFQVIPSQSVLFGKEFKSQGAYQPINCFGDQTV